MSQLAVTTKDELLAAVQRLGDEGLSYWAMLPPDTFCAPLREAWSPADNIRHLIKSTAPVTKALGVPRIVLWGLFGAASEPSRSYSDLVTAYRERLAAGGQAGRFAPKAMAKPSDAQGWQQELMARCRAGVAELGQAAGRWGERDLDRYRLPHPLLGKLTVREMLLFTLYHYHHHQATVARRLMEARPPN